MVSYLLKTYPYISNIFNKVEILNEIAIIFSGYAFLIFSKFVLDPEPKAVVG